MDDGASTDNRQSAGERCNLRRLVEDHGLTDAFCQQVFQLAMDRGRQLGLSAEGAEDSALEFVVHLLQLPSDVIAPPLAASWRHAWIKRSADNWVKNSRTREAANRQREVPLPNEVSQHPTGARITCGARDSACGAPEPGATVLRTELLARILDVVITLPKAQRELFSDRFILEASVQEISESTRRSPCAVRQAIWLLRRQLRKRLAKAGLDEVEVRQYLSHLRDR